MTSTNVLEAIMLHWRPFLVMSFSLYEILNELVVGRPAPRPPANGSKHLCTAILWTRTKTRKRVRKNNRGYAYLICQQALCDIVTIACIIPNSASSVILTKGNQTKLKTVDLI